MREKEEVLSKTFVCSSSFGQYCINTLLLQTVIPSLSSYFSLDCVWVCAVICSDCLFSHSWDSGVHILSSPKKSCFPDDRRLVTVLALGMLWGEGDGARTHLAIS